MLTILFPGRHHMLTKSQHEYLKKVIDKGVNGEKVDRIIFAVISSNHSNTRRNPLPLYLRAIGIEKFSKDLNVKVKVYPLPDVDRTEKFAKFIIHHLEIMNKEKINPKNTLIYTSTKKISQLFEYEGYKNLYFEKKGEKIIEPWKVIEILSKEGSNWKNGKWKKYASEASIKLYQEYNIGNQIIELYKDSLLNDNAEITETRDYNIYAKGMDQNAEFKFNDIEPFVIQGKIVDVGCGTGTLIEYLSKNFEESDIIGIEATRKFYEWCKMREYPNPFVFFYRRNILDQNFKTNTINTFIYSSVFHEVYSYIGRRYVDKVIKNTYNQLALGGRIIIRDVIGPEEKNKIVYLDLNHEGKEVGKIKELSIYSRFFKFVKDFKPRRIKYSLINNPKNKNNKLIKTTLQNAYEFISKMHYTDNWDSEMHEEFGYFSFKEWIKILKKYGFEIIKGSKEFKSEYIIEKMYKGNAGIYIKKGNNLIPYDYPATNIIIAAKKTRIR